MFLFGIWRSGHLTPFKGPVPKSWCCAIHYWSGLITPAKVSPPKVFEEFANAQHQDFGTLWKSRYQGTNFCQAFLGDVSRSWQKFAPWYLLFHQALCRIITKREHIIGGLPNGIHNLCHTSMDNQWPSIYRADSTVLDGPSKRLWKRSWFLCGIRPAPVTRFQMNQIRQMNQTKQTKPARVFNNLE